jgi:hypothetical protein
VVYTGSATKDAEHGGFAHGDINVIMLVSNPGFQSATETARWRPPETLSGLHAKVAEGRASLAIHLQTISN